MKEVYAKFEKENSSYVEARQLLRQYLPENLFSDINLPEVRVDYRPDNTFFNKQPSSESISLAITETIPGNVTFRGGEGATWIPPEISEDQLTLISLAQYYQFERLDGSINTVNLPERALKKVDIAPQSSHEIEVYRPTAINPKQFSRDHNSSYWYCNPDTEDLVEERDSYNAPQDSHQLAHSSSAISINAVFPNPVRRDSSPNYTFNEQHSILQIDPIGKALIQQIVFYSDEPTNLNMLKIQRIILGSEYTIKFHNSKIDEIRGVGGFQAKEDEIQNCALGYNLTTDGISFNLKTDRFNNFVISSSTLANLQSQGIQHYFINLLTIDYQENYFAAENFIKVLLTMADSWLNQNQGTIEGLRDWFIKGNNQFEKLLTASINGIHQLSRKKQEQVRKLASSGKNYISEFLEIYEAFKTERKPYQQHLRDSFQYGITQALKQVAQEVAGVEALNYVSAWTELNADFPDRASDRIWLYEIGMGGIGVMRATHDLIRQQPDKFWTILAEKMSRCSTAQEEAFLRHLLAQPENWLRECENWVQNITTASNSGDRQLAIGRLLAEVRRQLGVPVRQIQLKSLLRVFIPDYTQVIDGQPLVNWRIFQEINHQFLPDCADQLGRDPSFTEARAMLYRKIINARKQQTTPFPESERLLKLYEDEYGTTGEEARKTFESAVERRMLLNCRTCCSNCLDDRSSDIESPGLSRNLLNRPLLTEWLNQMRTHQTLEVADSQEQASICEQMRQMLEEGCQVIYLRVKSDSLQNLCSTISYLTDAGIDTDVGMVYPMITNIQTIYSNDLRLTKLPVIEVTIRPIQ
ncbi:MAG: hypothetical protein VKJ02_15595 [Snowella sp.]|nr:hypothetical protein [Snowella sp.]